MPVLRLVLPYICNRHGLVITRIFQVCQDYIVKCLHNLEMTILFYVLFQPLATLQFLSGCCFSGFRVAKVIQCLAQAQANTTVVVLLKR